MMFYRKYVLGFSAALVLVVLSVSPTWSAMTVRQGVIGHEAMSDSEERTRAANPEVAGNEIPANDRPVLSLVHRTGATYRFRSLDVFAPNWRNEINQDELRHFAVTR